MITYNGKQYNEPLDKGCPYYRIDFEKGIAAILPSNAFKYSDFKEHLISLETFLKRQVATTPITLNSYQHNRLEISRPYVEKMTRGKKHHMSLATYLVEGFDGPSGMYDHINHDPSDETDSNLRIVTPAQNACNKKLAKNNTLGYKGINRTNSKKGTYSAVAGKGGRSYSGLTYTNAIVAALAYNELATLHHDVYSSPNVITIDMLQELAKDPTKRPSLIKDLAKLDKRFGTGWSQAIAV